MVAPEGGAVELLDDLLPPIANATPAAAPAAAIPSRIHFVLPEEPWPGGAPEIVTAGGSSALASAAVGSGDGFIDARVNRIRLATSLAGS